MITPTDGQLDALGKILNVGIEKAAGTLNEMLDSHIEMKTPSIIVFDPEKSGEELKDLGGDELVGVQRSFHGSFSGSSLLVFPPESAVKMVTALTDEKPGSAGLNAVMADTLNEVGNILVNSLMGSINNLLSAHIDFSQPNYLEGKIADLLKPPGPNEFEMSLLIRTNFKVDNPQINGNIIVIFELDSVGDFFKAIDKFRDKS